MGWPLPFYILGILGSFMTSLEGKIEHKQKKKQKLRDFLHKII